MADTKEGEGYPKPPFESVCPLGGVAELQLLP